LLLLGCVSTGYLQENEYLLAQQTIKGNKKVKQEQLVPYYQQRTNRKFIGMPIWLWLYGLGRSNFNPQEIETKLQKTQERYVKKIAAAEGNPDKINRLEKVKNKKLAAQKKTLKEGNWLMRIGEEPVIYNPQQKKLTEDNLRHYLRSKGYFEADVSSTVKICYQKAYINYQIKEDKPHLIREFRLICPDSTIDRLLQPYKQQSLVQSGRNYDQEVLAQERERIQELLVNQGYWNFSKQYVTFQVDTTAQDQTVTVETVVALPDGAQYHQVYHIDSIVFELNPKLELSKNDPIHYAGIVFKNLQHHFSPQVIANKLPLTPGQLYSKTDIIHTQQRLSRLDLFKYIHITNDTTSSGHLTTYIQASLSDRFQLVNELGIQTSKILPNPFYKLSLKSRNLFKRLEILTLSTQVSVEGAVNTKEAKELYSSQTFNIDFGLRLPQFLLPLPGKTQTWLDAYMPSTKFKLGYNFDKRSDYTKNTIKTLFRYSWQGSERISFVLTPLHIDLIDAQLKQGFVEKLEARRAKGDNLYRAYKPSLVSNLSFRIILQKKPILNSPSDYSSLELLAESGGTLQNLIDFQKLISNRLTYYKYLKFHGNYVQHVPMQTNTKLAYQINFGIAYPYDQYKILPHDKYYFVGGPSSLRAWGPRAVGPGSYNPSLEESNQRLNEHPGELILQGNIEIRQKLVDMLEGALFIDAGNVWMVTKQSQAGEGFRWDRFYQEIALGTGVGLRIDFKFFILRFDFGVKVYDPSKSLNQRLFPSNIFKDFTVNIGLGYPF
jgi:outer membrane protein assembly factor BamA